MPRGVVVPDFCGRRAVSLVFVLGLMLGACGSETSGQGDSSVEPDVSVPDGAVPDAAVVPDAARPESCEFTYAQDFVYPAARTAAPRTTSAEDSLSPGTPAAVDRVAQIEPLPEATWPLRPLHPGPTKDDPNLVMPDYDDNMPLFERGGEWTTETRCYELPDGAALLTEAQAYALYRDIAELTTGVAFDDSPEVRKVVGLRGAYPGTFQHHGNLPDRFNDTLVLLWIDENGLEHVREFAAHTDTGAYDFGYHSSSSLRANRRYRYHNGWHRSTYNALHISEDGYLVWDDNNNNGFWDSDRNGWRPPAGTDDHERTGGGHNIHMGSLNPPLGTAAVRVWSAGCQVIPGMASWTEFIYSAWTGDDDEVSYFLVDVRDIDPRVWVDCTPDGSEDCPYVIDGFPFVHAADTSTVSQRNFDLYNCADHLDEGGPEVVYLFTVDRSGTLTATLDDVDGDAVDVDIHLLDANDPSACLERAHISFSRDIGPGRYFLVADTFVEGTTELSGPYTLTVDFQ